ncbi:hypothetical protein ACJX0J_028303, partial [Zea mays]
IHREGGHEHEAGDDGAEEEQVERAVHGDEPDRPVLAMPAGLGDGPQAAGAVRQGVRAQHHRRAGRQVLRGDGRHRRRRGEPAAGHAAVGRHPDRAAVDHLRQDDDHHAQGGAHHPRRQDHRRARRAGAHRQRRAAHGAVREQRHHPQHPHQRHRLVQQERRLRPRLGRPLRLAHRLRRRRRHRLRLHQRVAGPPLALQLPGRPHRRHRQVHRGHHLQLPPHQPQRPSCSSAPATSTPRTRSCSHADHHRLQPLRQGPRAEDAEVPQRLHALAHVRHRRQQGPHHHQPGQPLHRAAQLRGQA